MRSRAVAGASDRVPLLAVPLADREGSHRSRTQAVPLSEAVNVTDIDELPNRGGAKGPRRRGRSLSGSRKPTVAVVGRTVSGVSMPAWWCVEDHPL